MKYAKEVSTAVFLVLTLLPLVHAGYEVNIKGDVFLVRPDNEYIPDTAVPLYLEREDLTFFSCLEDEEIALRLSVVCLDNNAFIDVSAEPWGSSNCYIGSTNLQEFDCGKAVVQAEYIKDEENLKFEKEIRINKFSETLKRIIETQFVDGGWQTPLDTAHGVFVLNHYASIFDEEIEKAIEFLKLNRDDSEKCWPEEQCRISTTAHIIFLLDKAGFEDLRIQHDGYLYLEKTQNYISGTDWQLYVEDHPININETLNNSCVFEYSSTVTNFTLNKTPDVNKYNFTPAYFGRIGLACTQPAIVRMINEFDEQMVRFEGDNFTYQIPGSCWTRNNENISCDFRASLFAINTDITTSRANTASDYLRTLLESDRTSGQHFGNGTNFINDALYLHGITTDSDDTTRALLFSQANNGSWRNDETHYEYTWYEVSAEERASTPRKIEDGISQDIVTTGFAVMALLENGDLDREDEVIIDAERWVSEHEDLTTLNYTDEDLEDEDTAAEYRGNLSLILNDTKRNAMAWFSLKNNARPIIKTQPAVVVMNDFEIVVDLINPTIFPLEDLEYEIASDIESSISVEEKESIDAFSFRRIKITLEEENPDPDIGYIRIMQENNEYAKIPVIVLSTPSLNITLPERLTVFGTSTLLPFTISRTGHKFACSLEWQTEGISSGSRFDINSANGTYNYPVKFANRETENTIYEGLIVCTANTVTFEIPIAINILRFSSKPMEVRPQFVTINSSTESYPITIRNLLDQTIDVQIALTTPDPYLVVSDPFVSLFPGEFKNITVQVIPPEGENYTTSNALSFSTFDVTERVLIDAEIRSEPVFSYPLWLTIAIWVFIIGLVGILGYFGWSRRDALVEWYDARFKKEDVRKKVTDQIRELERQEELQAIRNMIKILKLQGIADQKVRERLIEEGYTEEDIDTALTTSDQKEEKEEEKKDEKK